MPVSIKTKPKAAHTSSVAKALTEAAIAYATEGYRVFRVAPSTNDEPLLSGWPEFATTELALIKNWWAMTPQANIAIACGVQSGLIVVDVDVKEGAPGAASLAELEKKHGKLTTRVARSPTGGWHYYFRSPGYKLGNRTGFLPGIDFRGDGGYIIAPPSVRAEGQYRWENDAEIADCPNWLLHLIKKHDAKPAGTGTGKIKVGERNSRLTSLAGAMRRYGVSQAVILQALLAQNEEHCDPPLEVEDIERIAESISKYAPTPSIQPVEISAAELISKEIPEPTWIIPGYLSTGLALLAGKPKIGKSWLTLAMAVAAAIGGEIFGASVPKQGVLYLALEDNESRLQKRLKRLLGDACGPERLHLVTGWKRLNEGGLTDLEARLQADTSIRLVVVDTVARLRKPSKAGGNMYLEDYEVMAGLKAVADKCNVAIVAVMHTRKMAATDPFDTISGTTGLTGAADTNIVLQRPRGGKDTVLHITGRDVEEQALSMRFNDGEWSVVGVATAAYLSKTKQKLMDTLKDATLAPKEIANKSGLNIHTVKKNLASLEVSGHVKWVGHGKYAEATK